MVRSDHRRLLVIGLTFVLLVLMHNAATPVFEAPDEVWHYAYVRWIAEGHGLPALDSDESGASQQAAQPPLYYLLAALVSRPFSDENLTTILVHNPGFGYQAPGISADNKNMLIHGEAERWPWQGTALAVHITRLASLGFGLLTILATYGLTLETTRSGPWALLGAALVAFHPQFIFICGVVSNDAAAAALSTTALWAAVRILRGGANTLHIGLAGVIAGSAALSKTSALLVTPMLGITIVYTLARQSNSRAARLQSALATAGAFFVIAALVGGWWYLRNLIQYGTPLGLARHVDTPWGRPELASLGQILGELPIVARSFWAAYGWGHVTWPDGVYIALWLATAPLLALAAFRVIRGWTMAVRRSGLWNALFVPGTGRDMLVLGGLWCLIWLLAVLVALLRWMQQVEAPHGRLLFPGLGAWAVLVSLGLREAEAWGKSVRIARIWRAGLLGACACLAALAPGARLAATFAAPRQMTVARVAERFGPILDMRYAGGARLLSASVSPARIRVGEEATVRACWSADVSMDIDYTVFVHLIGPAATRPGERHTYPGLGKYPTSAWVPGYAFCDTYVVPVETWAPAPIRYRIELGLYNATTGDRPMAYTVDGLPFDPPIVGSLNVVPAGHLDTEPQHPLIVDFGDAIRMVGYDLREAGTTSSTVSVTLHWEATGEPLQDYVAFVHLWSPGDPAPLAQHDSQPREGWYPTSAWEEGDRVPDEHTLYIPEALPSGTYDLWAGLYRPRDGIRLETESEGRRLPDDLVPLGPLEIVRVTQ